MNVNTSGDLLFKVYKIGAMTLPDGSYYYEPVTFLQAKDLVDVLVEENYLDPNSLSLQLKNFDLFQLLRDIGEVNTLMIERLVFMDDELLTNNNPIFFVNYFKVNPNFDTKENDFTIQANDIKGYLEARKIIEHNVFYKNVNPNEEPPSDFNKINFVNQTVDFILNNIYDRNVFVPVYRTKGLDPDDLGVDLTRRCKGLLSILVEPNTLPNYTSLQGKKSILDYKKGMFEYYQGLGVYDSLLTEIKLFETEPDKFQFQIQFKNNITYTIPYDRTKDKIIQFVSEYNAVEFTNDVLIESDSIDFDYINSKIIQNNFMSSFEFIDSGSNEGDDTTSLSTLAVQRLEENKALKIEDVEIDFDQFKFFKEIKAGNIIELTNFPYLIDGLYLIKTISETIDIENNTVYSIDEMEKIN